MVSVFKEKKKGRVDMAQKNNVLLKRFFYSAVCACLCIILESIVLLLDFDLHHVFVAWLIVAQPLAGVVLVAAGGAFYRLAGRRSLLVLSLVWLFLYLLLLQILPGRYWFWAAFAMDLLLSIVYLLVGRKQLMQQLHD